MSGSKSRKYLRRVPVLLDLVVTLMLLVLLGIWATRYLLAGQPLVMQIEHLLGSDKNMHLLLGFSLPLCVGWLVRLYRLRPLLQAGAFILAGFAYAGDEWFQSTLTFRTASLDDFVMSITGLLLAVAVWYSLQSLIKTTGRE